MRCYGLSKRVRRVRMACRSCNRFFHVVPSLAEVRVSCSAACRARRAPPTVACSVCGQEIEAYPSRDRRFCSLSCSNRARKGRLPMYNVERDRFILDLHAQGLKPREIGHRLETENDEWAAYASSMVRTVIYRAKRTA